MTLKKPLLIASLTAAVAMAAVSTKAEAGDPVLGALIGGGIGAAIGHDINRHGGGAVGGVVGALVGSSIAADSGRYYGPSYGPSYGYSYGPNYAYAPAPAYAAPVYAAPVYAAPVYPAYGVTYYSGYSGPRYYRAYDRGYYRHDIRRDARHWR